MATKIAFFDVPDDIRLLLETYYSRLTEIAQREMGDVRIHFIFIDTETMSQMNQVYRGKEGPTDVLTFVYKDDTENEEFVTEEDEENISDGMEVAEEPYAEGYICLDVVKKNAEEFKNTFERELITVLVHSLLHMSGYDHEYDKTNAEEMFAKQDMYVKQLFNE